MYPRWRHVLVLGSLVCALAAGAFAQDLADSNSIDSNARIVRLSFVQGDVRMDRPGAEGFDTAFLNMPVVGGSRIVTGDDGFAELEFESGGTVRLTPRSELNIRELGLRGDHKVSLLDLTGGTAYFNVKKDSDDDFRVTLSGQELRVPKSTRFRIRIDRDNADIAVTKGELELTGGEHDVRIKKQETLTLDFQDRGRYFLAKSVSPFSYDTWDQERDDYRDRYVAITNSYRGYSSSYSYGVSDLNYYGNYVNMPGYGYVWRPYGYDVSWDPFSDGAWVWYPGYGYTWVSGYSWGWMPYRYGRWFFIPGYGWVWQPGNSWHRWNTCSAVYNPPHYYHGPTRPVHVSGGGGHNGGHNGGHGSGGPVVVVGRGPFNGGSGGNPRFRNDGDGNPHARGTGTVQTGTGLAVTTPATGAVVPAPAVLTHGVDFSNNNNVAQELRRVHGEDLGIPRRRDRESNVVPVTGNTATTTTDTSTTTTGATTTTTTTTVTTPAPRPTQQVAVPVRPDTSNRGTPQNVPAPVTPQNVPAPAPPARSGGYTQHNNTSGGASGGSAYHPSNTTGGSTGHGTSGSSGSSGRTSTPPPPPPPPPAKHDHDPK